METNRSTRTSALIISSLLASLVLWRPPAEAEPLLYGLAYKGKDGLAALHRIDPASGAGTAIGPVGFEHCSAMDFDAAGTLFAACERADSSHTGVLVTIDLITGAGTEVGETGVSGEVADISFRNGDGVLYAYHEANDPQHTILTVDTGTGAATAVADTSLSHDAGNGIAFDAADTLFHSARDAATLNTLDEVTGADTPLVPLSFPGGFAFPHIGAMDFNGATLYGVLREGANPADPNSPASKNFNHYLVTIDTGTGVVTSVGATVDDLHALAWRDQGRPVLAYSVRAGADDQLYRIDLSSGAASAIGPVGFSDVTDLAFAPDGTLFGVDAATDALITIDTQSGAGSTVGSGLSLTVAAAGLTFDPAGDLWLATEAGQTFYSADPLAGTASAVGPQGQAVTGLGAASDGTVFGLGISPANNLVTLSTTTGSAVALGNLVNATPTGGAVEFDGNETLWGIEDGGEIFTVDAGTGQATVQATTLNGFKGLAIVAPRRPDHFVAHKIRTSSGSDKFEPFGPVVLADQFGAANYSVARPLQLLLPADKNGEGVADPLTHLEEYKVAPSRGAPRFQKLSYVRFVNQCSDLLVQVKKPVSLLVPTNKGLDGPVAAPAEGDHDLDHFLCYAARPQKKLPDGSDLEKFPKGMQVLVEDQFQRRRYDLKRITKVCNPAAKSEDPQNPPLILGGPNAGTPKPIAPASIRNPDSHLVCYRAVRARKIIAQNGCGPDAPSAQSIAQAIRMVPKQQRHDRLAGVHLNNQFGPEQVDTVKELEVCLPSLKRICGDNEVNTDAEQCDGTDDTACPGLCESDCTCHRSDECAEARSIGAFPYTDTQLTLPAGTAPDDPALSCGAASKPEGGDSIWYSFTATAQGIFVVDTFGSNYDTVLAAFTGTCGSLVEEACNNQTLGNQSRITLEVTAGQSYVVEVTSSGTSSGGTLVLNASFTPAPANDDCTAATTITAFPFTDTVDTTGATTALDDPALSCPASSRPEGSHSVWYTFTPAQSGTVTADTLGSNYDTVLAAFTGSCGSLTEVSCNDDKDFQFSQSEITFAATSGTTYFLEVTSFGNFSGGDMTLDVSLE